jgi:nitrile hydratase subunit beta
VDGIHDMGGMQGFGPVAPEADEPAFHEPWEGRVFGTAMSLWATGTRIGSLRPEIERIETTRYLTLTYYEKWLEALTRRLEARGLLAPGELERRAQELAAGGAVPRRDDPANVAAFHEMMSPAPAPPAGDDHRFAVGQRVRVRRISTSMHNRCPRYVRGASGVVERLLAPAELPENADTGGEAEAPGYTVAFAASELWPDDGADHVLLIDLWETYLEEAE